MKKKGAEEKGKKTFSASKKGNSKNKKEGPKCQKKKRDQKAKPFAASSMVRAAKTAPNKMPQYSGRW